MRFQLSTRLKIQYTRISELEKGRLASPSNPGPYGKYSAKSQMPQTISFFKFKEKTVDYGLKGNYISNI